MHHNHAHDTSANIRVAFFLNLGFTLLEIVGGLWTNSMAILSDAVHDLGDSLSLGLAWYLERYAQRSQDTRFSYGYRRFSLLGALLTTIFLIAGSIVVLSEALPRLVNPEPAYAPGMVVFALGGILVNGLAMLRLRGRGSLNQRVAAWHLLEDVLGWIAVLVVSLVLLVTDLHILDPILSVLITLYVLFNVGRNLRRTAALFLQAVPEGVDMQAIETRLRGIEKVLSTHHTHVWSMDGDHHVLTMHVVVEDQTSRAEVMCIKEEISRLSQEYDLVHTTVEIEYEDEGCRMVDS